MKKFICMVLSALLSLAVIESVYAFVPIQGSDTSPNIQIDGNYWALIIGINEYPNLGPEMQLQAARADAQAVATVLQKQYGFAKERMIQLYDRKASRDGIILALETLAATIGEKDSLLIYYSGHGEYNSNTKRGVWIPSDGLPNKPSTYVNNADIRDYLESIKAKHIYTISDSCFSESLMGKTRSIGGDRAIKELYSAKSRWILTSGGLYPVPDKSKGNHSVFAYHLIRLLENNENQYLTPMQVINEIMPRVSNESMQTPKSAPVALAGDEGGQFVFVRSSGKAPMVAGSDSKKTAEKTSEKPAINTLYEDTTPPSITVTSPDTARGVSIVGTSKTTVKGRAADESGVAEVFVNGKEASLDKEGNFSAEILLRVGENAILIQTQ
jgi:hypothetical protein